MVTEQAVRLPDVGEGVAQAEIVTWHVAVGDHVEEGGLLADVMTDKATVELPSPFAGTVTWLAAAPGDLVAVGSDLVRIRVDESGAPTPPASVVTPRPAEPHARTPEAAPRRPLAAPAVRRRASILGIDLGQVHGTGDEGRIRHEDLDRLLATRPATPLRPGPQRDGHHVHDTVTVEEVEDEDEVEVTRLVGLRRNIARRMEASSTEIPHFTYVEEVDVTELQCTRAALTDEAQGHGVQRLTLLPFLARAVVLAVGSHPEVNARFDRTEGVVHRHRAVHLGVAVQTAQGLMVTVVHHAESLDLWSCAAEIERLSESARTGRATLEELRGSTITLSSLGALGGVVATPIINHPEVAIVGVNRAVPRPVVRDGALVVREMMNLSSSFDHRVVDGYDAARFIQRIRSLLETPALLFV